jgi:hypothetical protein
MYMPRVFVGGSSTAYGDGDTLNGGWAGRLKTGLPARHELVNLAVRGQTLPLLCRRLPGQLNGYAYPSSNGGPEVYMPPSVGVFMVGKMDAMQLPTPKESEFIPDYCAPRPTPEAFRQALGELLAICSDLSVEPIFVDPGRVNEEQIKQSFGGNPFVENERIALYGDIVRETVKGYAPFVNVPGLGNEHISSDGIHPNESGHLLIHDAVRPVAWNALSAVSVTRSF